ncbi:uncharacterized protein LOC126378291 [Pectinophora gossypiella]|uniref:uncharacterized protein LOC126378291 n=1 Tax=Pectinophora gossypiella TaxID=13191 RepID=UPI00214EC891|nr:uncharacterized protein LOC126378291 [Pectinophora gossypiella]
MAPSKFGLFKARSRDQADQPSTENLLQTSNSSDNGNLGPPGSPIPSTSKGLTEDLTPEDISDLNIDSEDDEVSEKRTPVRRRSLSSRADDSQVNYHPLKNQTSTDATSTLTLHEDQPYDELGSTLAFEIDNDGASTSADCNSIQMDDLSVAPSEDISVYCGTMKKPKKSRSKEEKQLRDLDMWQASNVEVMQNLLSRSGTLDEQIKWEAIATARGLCTLTDSCTCPDCKRAKYLTGVTDGDGGLGAAPLFSAISVGCSVQ